MGCDIHFFVETKQNDGTWKSADTWVSDDWDPGRMKIPYDEHFYQDRNYNLFAILANVRNYSDFNPISEPRGLPEDASPDVKAQSDVWDMDGHSHSYLTVTELKAYDWDQQTQHQGIVNLEEFKVYLQKGKPNSWGDGVFGPNVVIVEREEGVSFISDPSKIPKDKEVYINVDWTESYRDSAGEFLTKTLPKLEVLGDPENVRIVFWFDN